MEKDKKSDRPHGMSLTIALVLFGVSRNLAKFKDVYQTISHQCPRFLVKTAFHNAISQIVAKLI